MRITVYMSSEKPITLPINYNYIMQAVVLRWLGDESYQKFVHDTGYIYKKRNYKLYTFSRLEGIFKLDKVKKSITFPQGAKLTIASVDEKFLNYLVNNIICKDKFKILNNEVYIEKIDCSADHPTSPLYIRTKSPIVIYSTFQTQTSKKTYYYNPYEKDFSEMLRQNLIRKYKALHDMEPEDSNFTIEIADGTCPKESVLIYKGTVIRGWNGKFLLKGSDALLTLAYDAGLGSKNSQGFGCIEII